MLCVAWHPTEMALYSGTAKARILGWDLRAVLSSTSSTGRTARAAMRITLERLVKDQVSVWALRVLEYVHCPIVPLTPLSPASSLSTGPGSFAILFEALTHPSRGVPLWIHFLMCLLFLLPAYSQRLHRVVG